MNTQLFFDFPAIGGFHSAPNGMACSPVQTGSGTFRVCKKCGRNMPLSKFYKCNSSSREKIYFHGICVSCFSENRIIKTKQCKTCGTIIHRPNNIIGAWKQRSCEKCVRKMALETKKRWRERHPEKMQACRDNWNAKNKNKRVKKIQEWVKKNRNRLNMMARIRYKNNNSIKTYYNEYRRKKVRTDPNYKIRAVLRARLSAAMKAAKTSKSANTLSLLGCSVDEFKKHIESQFLPGMSWENHSYDGWHLDHIVPCAAFDLTNPEQQGKCFHYSNIRPLWADDNFRKQKKIIS